MRKRFFLLRLAVLNTFKRRLRASLAIASIAFSAGVMVIFFGIGDGLQHLVLTQVGQSDLRDVITMQSRNTQQVTLDQTLISNLKSVSGVGTVEQSVGLVGKLIYHGIDLDIPLYGVSDHYFDLVSTKTAAGKITDAIPSNSQNVILTTSALKVFGVSATDIIGKTINIGAQIPNTYASQQQETTKIVAPQAFTVVGVIDKEGAASAYIPLDYLSHKGVDTVAQLKVRVTYAQKVDDVREAATRMGLQTSSILDTLDQVNKIFSVIQRILLFFGMAALVVTVFGTFNTITITLIEETPQIGFLRLMGMHRHDVRLLFLAQSIMLTTSGAVIGITAGYVIGGILNLLVKGLVTDTSLTGQIYIFQIPYIQIIIILMLSVLLGWLVGLMPAKRAVTINPLDALHS